MEHIRTVLFNRSTLTFDKTKRKWYVLVTVPPELVGTPGFKNKQIKRSTGTSDEALAKKLQHQITDGIYKSFSKALQNGQFKHTLKFLESEGVKAAKLDAETTGDLEETLVWIRAKRDLGETNSFDLDDKAIEEIEDVLADQNRSFEPKNTLRSVAEAFTDAHYKQNSTRRSALSAINEFASIVGDLELDAVDHVVAFKYLDKLEADGQANKTIRKKLGFIKKYFEWAFRRGFVDELRLRDVSSKGMGRASVSYKPMPLPLAKKLVEDPKTLPHQRLLFACLFFTGHRLDEWAQVNYEQINEHPDGFRYVDLEGSVLKTGNSQRCTPLHPLLDAMLPRDGTGRIWPMYRLDDDGKATDEASEDLMKVIKRHTDDPLIVNHSFRHLMADLLREAGIEERLAHEITGHAPTKMGNKYGAGSSLQRKYEALLKIEQDVFS